MQARRRECLPDCLLMIMVEMLQLFHQTRLQLGDDVMNPAAVHTLLQLPPDPVVYRVDVRTVGWPEIGVMKSGVHWLKRSSVENIMFTVYVYYMSANVTPGPVIALTKVVLETEIFHHRYLKYNNSTFKQYFTANFCGSFIDIFKIQCT